MQISAIQPQNFSQSMNEICNEYPKVKPDPKVDPKVKPDPKVDPKTDLLQLVFLRYPNYNQGMLNIEALILAAGAARRFGRPKQLLPWGAEQTILSHVIDTVQATPGIVATHVILGAWFDEITENLTVTLKQVNIVRNLDWQTGMFSSLKAGLNQFAAGAKTKTGNVDGIIILLGDMPFISSAALSQFVVAARADDKRPLIACENDRPAHPYLIRPAHIGEILSLSGESGIRPFIQKEFPGALKIKVENAVGRRDIDTWESYFKNRPAASATVTPPPPG